MKMLTKEFDYNEKIYTREPVETILNFWKKKEDIKTFEKVEHFKYKNEEEFLKEMTEFIEEKKDNIINVITLEELKVDMRQALVGLLIGEDF